MQPRLGAFQLLDVIGQGGMSHVWSGVHVDSGVPVAIKVLTSELARSGSFASALESEVRAVASLHHPGIVTVLDYGYVPRPSNEAELGWFEAGSPYLVMELATGGTLQQLRRASDYPALRAMLLALLDALAHAHARNVIHRDLCPRNILVATERDLFPGLKIADFGIAFAYGVPEANGGEEFGIGTVEYMAPEQLRARWRDYGPWTDLYALGVIAHRLACGSSPWPTGSARRVLEARIKDERIAMSPEIETPPGFVSWVDRLLRASPRDRFQCAADAACALAALGGEQSARERDAPPIPSTWRSTGSRATPIRLVGAGLNLYPLRSVPFVDRERERDRLWEGLREVHARRGARAFLLIGPVGSGKSRLSEWTAQRAHELGAAAILTAVHGRFGSTAQGLGPMVLRHLRCLGAKDHEIAQRIEDELRALGAASEAEWSSLATLVSGRSGMFFAGASERYELLRRFIALLARERPVIVRIEDAQWASEALGFVRYVLAARTPTPVLFLMTAESAALADRTVEAEELAEIMRSPNASSLEVAPLDPDHHRELVRRLLPLEPSLHLRIAKRTQGNPLFAVQIIGDWVQRGLLVASPEGFRLRAEPASFPDDVGALWSVRIEELLRGQAANLRVALELAAALGQEVDRAEWVETCTRLTPAMERGEILDLERKLFATSLARERENGFAFGCEPIRDAFEQSARRAGRWAQRHRQVANMLRLKHPKPRAEVEERLARHSQAAGEIAAAVDHWYRAAEMHFRLSALTRALSVLSEHEALLSAHEVSDQEELRAKGWLLRARVLLQLGQHAEADRLARCVTTLKEKISFGTFGQATFVRGQVEAQRSRFEQAVLLYEGAASMLGGAGDVLGEGRCYRELGYVAQQCGDLELAVQHLDLARDLLSQAGDQLELAYTFARMGLVLRQQGSYGDSQQHFERAVELFSGINCRHGLAVSFNGIGDAHRLQGDAEEAERFYRESISRYEAIFVEPGATSPRLSLALLALSQGRYCEAYQRAEQAMVAAEAADQRGLLGCAELIMLPHLAQKRETEEWKIRLDRSKRLLKESGFVDVDVAWSAELAAGMAKKQGWLDDAAVLGELARRAVGVEGRGSRVESSDFRGAGRRASSRDLNPRPSTLDPRLL